MVNATIFFHSFPFSFLLISIFDVRRYNGSYELLMWLRLMKFTAFNDELVEKTKSISNTHGGFKIFP